MLHGVHLFLSFSMSMLFKFLLILSINIIINFKVPEVPKKVPDEKIPVVEPKKPAVPPAKGTCHYDKINISKPSLFYCFNAVEDSTQDLC